MVALAKYKKKRNFKITPEPKAKAKNLKKDIFVIQKHFSKRVHFDFRLKLKNVLKSWAVPKGLPKSTIVKTLAVMTEDHPLAYAKFEGTIPKGEYGAGKVVIYDKGYFENIKKDKSGKIIPLAKCIKNGHIEVFLHGKKINSAYALIKFQKEKNSWLAIKMKKR